MRPFLPLRNRLASPLLLLLLVGGAIALGEYWMRCQLVPTPAVRRSPRNPVERAPRSYPAATPHSRRRRLTLKLLVIRLEGAPALTICPFPASGRPFWTPFGARNR